MLKLTDRLMLSNHFALQLVTTLRIHSYLLLINFIFELAQSLCVQFFLVIFDGVLIEKEPHVVANIFCIMILCSLLSGCCAAWFLLGCRLAVSNLNSLVCDSAESEFVHSCDLKILHAVMSICDNDSGCSKHEHGQNEKYYVAVYEKENGCKNSSSFHHCALSFA